MHTVQPLAVLETITKIIKQNLTINIQPKNATNIGKKVYMVKMKTKEGKREVMQNKAQFKQISSQKIYTNDELTKYEREQKIIK